MSSNIEIKSDSSQIDFAKSQIKLKLDTFLDLTYYIEKKYAKTKNLQKERAKSQSKNIAIVLIRFDHLEYNNNLLQHAQK
ncbi:hypothetical protein BpHYR1_053445 [Brachionus plicatilis]|uniref:Uncharacterized protein n=1 Tax=Brachionus plicatilis TaxID=10195 RepID=A0A3M7PE10_BRAPC|nr:hypothetical protein BpHYR1_053445 [Brachionus plicatilis]